MIGSFPSVLLAELCTNILLQGSANLTRAHIAHLQVSRGRHQRRTTAYAINVNSLLNGTQSVPVQMIALGKSLCISLTAETRW